MNFADNRPYVETERIMLEKLKFACSGVVSRAMLEDSTLRFAEDFMINQIQYMFETKLLGREEWKEEREWSEKEEDFPCSWWDHTKQALKTHHPRLFGRLRIKTREVSVKVRQLHQVYRVCPHLNISSDKDQIHFEWLKNGDR